MWVAEGKEPVPRDETDACIPTTNVFVHFADGGKHRRDVKMSCVADLEVSGTPMQSHCEQFATELANEPTASGKKLEFLTQELLRELNTIGSKSPDTRIRSLVIEGKSELERIREQLANVE